MKEVSCAQSTALAKVGEGERENSREQSRNVFFVVVVVVIKFFVVVFLITLRVLRFCLDIKTSHVL